MLLLLVQAVAKKEKAAAKKERAAAKKAKKAGGDKPKVGQGRAGGTAQRRGGGGWWVGMGSAAGWCAGGRGYAAPAALGQQATVAVQEVLVGWGGGRAG